MEQIYIDLWIINGYWNLSYMEHLYHGNGH